MAFFYSGENEFQHTIIYICAANVAHSISLIVSITKKLKTITKKSDVKLLCQHGFAKMQTASSLEELVFYYKNLCFVILPERSNSRFKDAYEQLIEKFEGLNMVNEEEEREEHINDMNFYLQ